jgi:putative membrane protein
METTDERVRQISRPHPNLLKCYVLSSLKLGPLFPVALVYLYFRYHTLRYRFDDEGVSMAWGALFHREIYLNYARIQDIHLTSGVVERYLGLARIHVQTASGQAKAEMVIEGVLEVEIVRDFLYARMRGQNGGAPGAAEAAQPSSGSVADLSEAVQALREAAAELGRLRELIERRSAQGEEP